MARRLAVRAEHARYLREVFIPDLLIEVLAACALLLVRCPFAHPAFRRRSSRVGALVRRDTRGSSFGVRSNAFFRHRVRMR